MKVRILSTKQAPLFLRRIMGQVLRGPAPTINILRRQVPYWRDRGWRQAGNDYRGTYQTSFGSFLGLIEEVRPGKYRLYIYDPPKELRTHSHWTCFQDLGNGRFRIHMSEMPRDVGSGILRIERLLTEAFEG